MRFARRVALVTGAAGGIGASVAELLAAEGAVVGVVDLNHAAAEKVATRLRGLGGEATSYACDVSDARSVDATVERLCQDHGRVDILVTCAGVLRDNLLFKMSDDDWRSVIDTHLTGTFNCARAVQRPMVAQRHGKMVFLSSDSAGGSRGQANYSAAKAGIEGLAKTLAIELGKFGVNVNAVAPGFVETEMTRATAQRIGLDYEEFKANSAAKAALGRVATPEDIARVIAFLASDDSAIMTGQVLLTRGSP
ncbi:3-oxoacyl-ACP reductase FabG [Streptosporangium sp. NPDC006007]|uniref:3-oxoacyl-ACP reductase FabG n=1 Tax=Streptosporangium sp. NPDC006007 TaxID=3154575 RepID=UPI0033A4C072